MRRLLTLFISLLWFCSIQAHYTVERSTMRDNWFVNLNTGITGPSSHAAFFEHLTSSIGLRTGRGLTPSYALALHLQTFFGPTPGSPQTDLSVHSTHLSLEHVVNLNNWICGYNGRPDVFEIFAIAGLGWGHDFQRKPFDYHKNNYLTSRFEFQFCVNFGKQRAWQVSLSPYIIYRMSGQTDGYQPYFNINHSHMGLQAGVTYRLGNRNGTHSFQPARLYDQVEIDVLNAKINDLQEEVKRLRKP